MKKTLSVLITIILPMLMIVPVASAQQVDQSTGGSSLQQQQTGAQDTGQVQNNTAPLQQNSSNSVLNENQPKSIGVVGGPDQTKPSLTVSAPNSKSSVNNAPSRHNSTNYGVFVSLLILILISYIVARLFKTEDTIPEPVVVKVAKKKKQQSTPVGEVKKSSKTKAKKKKKKSVHR